MIDKSVHQISGRRLAYNTVWNLAGTGLPLFAAAIAIPILIEGMGTPRFGVLTLIWMIVGYFSLFDFGLGRALTNLVAVKLGEGKSDEIPELAWSAIAAMVFLGVVGTITIISLAPFLVYQVLKIPIELQWETIDAFYALSVSIPIVTASIGFRGFLEAYQCFRLVNTVRIPLGILTFLGPLAVLPFSNSLLPMVAVLVMGRLLMLIAYFCMSLRQVSGLCDGIRKIKWYTIQRLLAFGGWMTVTNVISPIMVYCDRLFIGSMISMLAVAYYATPHEMMTKLGIISGAIVGVLFPAFSTAIANHQNRVIHLFDRGVDYVFIFLFPLVFLIVTFAYEGLELWLGDEFTGNSVFVLQCLAFGMLVNSLARIPATLIQGIGRPDITAKLHLSELPIYLAVLWWLVNSFGVKGAAIAWTLRVIGDACALFIVAGRLLPSTLLAARRVVVMVGFSLPLLWAVALIPTILSKCLALGVVLVAFILATWNYLLLPNERSYVGRYLKPLLSD